jgi:hypothetical protein
MDKQDKEAVLRQDTEWTSQRHRQYWDKTRNGQVRERGSIETRHRMDKPEKQAAFGTRHIIDKTETLAVLGRDTEWANQNHKQH